MKKWIAFALISILIIGSFVGCEQKESDLQNNDFTTNALVTSTQEQTRVTNSKESGGATTVVNTQKTGKEISAQKPSKETTTRTSTQSSNTKDSTSPNKETTTVAPACVHTWERWVDTQKATCYQTGLQSRKCVSCLKEECKSTEKLSHKSSDWIIDSVATENKEGKKHIECIYCKKVIKEERIPKIEKAHTHEGSYYITAREPTCKKQGVKYLLCSCGEIVTIDMIKTIEHTVVTDKAVAATCFNAGLTEGKHCSVCDTVIVGQTVIPQKEHISASWTVIVPPTENETGLKNNLCSVCGSKYTETLPALKDTDPSEFNQILYEWREDGYWVTDVFAWTNPILTIPSTHKGKAVVGIAEKAFYKNTVFEEVVISRGVKNYGYRSFYKCTSLKKVTLPEDAEVISSGMFEGCKELVEVNMPACIKKFCTRAFASCVKLRFDTITLYDGAFTTDSFYNTAIGTLTIKGKNFTGGFGSSVVEKLILDEGIETIKERALEYAWIGELSLPTTLKTIEYNAFYGAKGPGVNKIVLHSPIHLNFGAFNGCRSMKEIVIPKGSTFDTNVFMNCDNLETVYFGGTRAEWQRLIAGYGYTQADFKFISGLHVVCSDDV